MHSVHRRLFPFLTIAVLSIALISCDSSGSSEGTGEGELSAKKAKNQVENVDSELSSSTSQLILSGNFSSTMQGLFLGTSGSTSSKQSTQSPLGYVLVDELGSVVETSNGRLDYPASTGVYNWDSSSESWVSGESSEDLVLNFPTSRSAANSTATFTLSAYQDQGVTIEDDMEYIPSTLSASLTVSGNEIFAVDLSNTAFYSSQVDGTQVPKSFSLEVLTAPQKQTYELSSPSKQEFEFAFDLEKSGNDELVLGILVNAALKSNFDQVSSPQGIDELSGDISFGTDVTLSYTAQVDELAALGEDPTAQQLNDRFTAAMNYKGQKIGDIEVGQNNAPVLVYNDGSSEPLAQAFGQTYSSVGRSPASAFMSAIGSVTSTVQKKLSKAF